MFGSAPAPSPLVSLWPICSFTPARLWSSAWTSVFATMNSTPPNPTSTMRLTALLPPPPTPTTLIFAPRRACSSSVSRSFSSRPWGTSNSFMIPPGPDRTGHDRHESGYGRTPPSEKFFEDAADGDAHAIERAATARRVLHPVAVRIQHHTDRRREHGTAHVVRQSADAHRQPAPDRQIENLFADLRHALENRATAGEDDARVQRLLVAGPADLVPHEVEDFFRSGLQD